MKENTTSARRVHPTINFFGALTFWRASGII